MHLPEPRFGHGCVSPAVVGAARRTTLGKGRAQTKQKNSPTSVSFVLFCCSRPVRMRSAAESVAPKLTPPRPWLQQGHQHLAAAALAERRQASAHAAVAHPRPAYNPPTRRPKASEEGRQPPRRERGGAAGWHPAPLRVVGPMVQQLSQGERVSAANPKYAPASPLQVLASVFWAATERRDHHLERHAWMTEGLKSAGAEEAAL